MARQTFRNQKAGDRVTLSAGGHTDDHVFLGFTDDRQKYAEAVAYQSADALFGATGVKSFKELDLRSARLDGAGREYGFGHYLRLQALKKDGSADYEYSAYRFNGRWNCGTGADAISIVQAV